MYFFYIEIFAPIASFRVPETHIFQQTLPLPPVTTIIGILGAAAGLSFQQAMEYCDEKKIKFGVIGEHEGRTKDLWKYRKIKSDAIISAVLLREYLYNLKLCIFFATEDEATDREIRKYFLDPVYALTAGNSDNLIKVERISEVSYTEIVNATEFSNTILPGDLKDYYETNIDLKNIPLLQDIYAPQIVILPTSFDFYGDERRVRTRKAFTFTDIPIKLRDPIESIVVDGKVVPLL